MLKKQYLTRLEKLYRKLAPRNQEGGILIGDVADPIPYKGRVYKSVEEFHEKFPNVRIVVMGLLKETKKWEEERERRDRNKRLEPPHNSFEKGK
jgi:hypothetical protein